MIIGIVCALLIVLGILFWFSLTVADRSVLFSRADHLNVDGLNRTYRVIAPGTTSEKTKLIFGFDGFGGSGRRFGYYAALHNVAQDAVIVYPDPLPPQKKGQIRGWNAGFCCGSGWVEGTDDVGFVLALRKRIIADYGLSSETTYATGFSNGAFLVERLAAEHPEVFQAVAVMAGTIGTDRHKTKPSAAVSILLMHGVEDSVVPINGGASPTRNRDFSWISFEESVKAWESVADGGVTVRHTQIPGVGHEWVGWRRFNIWHKKPKMSQDIVAFFNEIAK